MVSNFLNLFARSIFVPTPSVQETITGSLILILLISKSEPKAPILSKLKASFVFLTFFLDKVAICFINLLAVEMSTPLFL